jgi:hypothetical protein
MTVAMGREWLMPFLLESAVVGQSIRPTQLHDSKEVLRGFRHAMLLAMRRDHRTNT